MKSLSALLVLLAVVGNAFVPQPTRRPVNIPSTPRYLSPNKNDGDNKERSPFATAMQSFQQACMATLLALSITTATTAVAPQPAMAAEGAKIAICLFQKCQLPLAKCIINPNCLANVICINTCNGKEDETGCQIECGNLFENDVVGEFNKCAVSDMECVPKKEDDGSYPVPPPENLVEKFDTSLFDGRWYITAGQNKLFDIFPCQVHFFTNTAPGTFYGKLNWRIEEPDGEFFNRDALQRFIQDPKEPAHLINHDNEYLHYQDDWYIVDYASDKEEDPFAFVYYRGSNDAWDGYGGAVIYTRSSKLPPAIIPRLREAAKKVNMDFDRDFTQTDNTCPTMKPGEALVLREKFAGKVALQTEQQLQAQATMLRGNAANSVKAQVLFVEKQLEEAEKAFNKLSQDLQAYEEERAIETQK